MSSFTTSATNPFTMAEEYSQISFACSKTLAGLAESYFDDIALSVSAFETDEAKGIWKVDVVTDQQPDEVEIERRLKLLADSSGEAPPQAEMKKVEPEMWQHNLHQFPPLHIGRYLIHGSHIKPQKDRALIPICVDAGMAFGSGEHATTEGCLMLFDQYIDSISKHNRLKDWRVLDMGCGSAILAMAAAKRLKDAAIIGVDIDKVSVQVAKENAKINGVREQLKLYLGNGYQSKAVMQAAPYDLVFANILAKPLMRMAKDLSKVLDKRGVAILSGLLTTQEEMVLGAHRLVGLKLKKTWRKDGWSALLLTKE